MYFEYIVTFPQVYIVHDMNVHNKLIHKNNSRVSCNLINCSLPGELQKLLENIECQPQWDDVICLCHWLVE